MDTERPIIVKAPASKSVSHRMVMGASLAHGESIVENVLESQDLYQTMEILIGAGAHIEKLEQGKYKIIGAQPKVVKTCSTLLAVMCMNPVQPAV